MIKISGQAENAYNQAGNGIKGGEDGEDFNRLLPKAGNDLSVRSESNGQNQPAPSAATPPATGQVEVYGRNLTDGSLASASGLVTAKDWENPGRIVGNLTQNPANSGPNDGNLHCGTSDILAGAILSGPETTASLLDRAASNAGTSLSPDQKTDLVGIAKRIRGGNATFEDLNQAQTLLYRAADKGIKALDWWTAFTQKPGATGRISPDKLQELDNLLHQDPNELGDKVTQISTLATEAWRDVTARVDREGSEQWVMLDYNSEETRHTIEGDGLNDHEFKNAAIDDGLTVAPIAYNPSGPVPIQLLLKQLQNNQAAVVSLAGNDSDSTCSHWILVGRLADGRPYIYNSDPQKGDATFIIGRGSAEPDQMGPKDDFQVEVAKYDKRANSSADDSAAIKISYDKLGVEA